MFVAVCKYCLPVVKILATDSGVDPFEGMTIRHNAHEEDDGAIVIETADDPHLKARRGADIALKIAAKQGRGDDDPDVVKIRATRRQVIQDQMTFYKDAVRDVIAREGLANVLARARHVPAPKAQEASEEPT